MRNDRLLAAYAVAAGVVLIVVAIVRDATTATPT
jgi:hypothetical protein